MISLLLHESKAKPRMNVNNKDIQMFLGYNLLIYQSVLLFTMNSTGCVTYQSFLGTVQ